VPFSDVEQAPADKAFVYVYRPTDKRASLHNIRFRVLMDDHLTGTASYGSYFRFAASPGTHVLTSSYSTSALAGGGGLIGMAGGLVFSGIRTAAEKPAVLTIDARAGENVYVKLHPAATDLYFVGNLSQVPESTAISEMKGTNREKP
jgi:hypothetical protein